MASRSFIDGRVAHDRLCAKRQVDLVAKPQWYPMIIQKDETKAFPIPQCHGGYGSVLCREILGDYDKTTPGFKFVHEDLLEPGVSIGEHQHLGDEEVYYILQGKGEMLFNGVVHEVGAGDVCLTRHGDRHSLKNTGEQALRLLVIGAYVGATEEESA